MPFFDFKELIVHPTVQVGEFNRYRRALKAEKMAMRTAIYPVLQAEEDRRWEQLSSCEYVMFA